MALEIERKFLVKDNSYKELAKARVDMMQAYLSTIPEATVRVRVAGDCGFITVKGVTTGCERQEWEYEIPVSDAREMASLAPETMIEKTRWIVDRQGYTWEIDEFRGRLSGLTVAEVELKNESEEPPLPSFVGREVTGDVRYYNSSLACCATPPPCSSR